MLVIYYRCIESFETRKIEKNLSLLHILIFKARLVPNVALNWNVFMSPTVFLVCASVSISRALSISIPLSKLILSSSILLVSTFFILSWEKGKAALIENEDAFTPCCTTSIFFFFIAFILFRLRLYSSIYTSTLRPTAGLRTFPSFLCLETWVVLVYT